MWNCKWLKKIIELKSVTVQVVHRQYSSLSTFIRKLFLLKVLHNILCFWRTILQRPDCSSCFIMVPLQQCPFLHTDCFFPSWPPGIVELDSKQNRLEIPSLIPLQLTQGTLREIKCCLNFLNVTYANKRLLLSLCSIPASYSCVKFIIY